MSEIDPLDLTPSASIGALRRFGSQADTDALVADAVLGERLRIGAILTCEAAKGRIDAAINVAIRSSRPLSAMPCSTGGRVRKRKSSSSCWTTST